MPFNIFFHGLVCHRTEENTSVFVAAEGHELRLVVRNADVIDANGLEADPVDDALHQIIGLDAALQKSYRVAGRVLTVKGTEPAQPAVSSFFRQFVPSLRANANCPGAGVRSQIVNHEVGGMVSGYLRYPGGVYSVNDFFAEKHTLTGFAKDAKCIARTIRLALTTNGSDVTIGDAGGAITLKRSAAVRFVNVLPPFVGAGSNMHFPHYYHAMYEGCHDGKAPTLAGGTACNHRHDPSFATPNGDCGNTGDP
ncbi:MAG: hypothetical protein QOJ98_3497 [Acidobacteriota bacterium]|jgi:hypothetical protein|nr:hypothetical protein [Acidobacteriota bacterium]